MNTVTIDIESRTRDAAAIADTMPQRGLAQRLSGHEIPAPGDGDDQPAPEPDWWAQVRSAVTATVLVIEIGGRIAGFTTIGRNRAELQAAGRDLRALPAPEYQGIGLGSRLFAAARRRLSPTTAKGLVVWALEEPERAGLLWKAPATATSRKASSVR